MRVLIDTCTFLWIAGDAAALSPRARMLFRDPGNEVYLSAVSGWEIAVKHGLGRLVLPTAPDRFVPEQREAHGIVPLALDEESVLQVTQLPDLHRDPFDRILVCQAIAHGLVILTPDPLIARYPVRTVW